MRIVTTLLLCGFMTGCSGLKHWWHNDLKVGPNYAKPIVQTASNWVDANDMRVQNASCPDLAGWWKVYNDPLLEDLVLAAFQQNLTLRTAGLRVLEARADRRIAAANLLPQSQRAIGQYSRNRTSGETFNGRLFGPARFDDFQLGFDMSWELDVWGRLRRSIELSDAELDRQIENYDDILVTLIGDVAASYIQLRTFDERIRLARKNAKIQAGSLDLANKQFVGEKVSELDVQEARTNLTDTLASIPALEQQRRLLVNQLAVLLGTTPYNLEPVLRAEAPIPYAPLEAVVGIPAELLRRRPDIRAAERTVAGASAAIGIAEAELYPQFGFDGQIVLNADSVDNLFTSNALAGTAVPGFRWKILNYGRLKNGIRIRELQFQQSITQYENTVLGAFREVEDAIVQFLKSQEQVAALQESVVSAERSVELVRARYRAGETDFSRVFVLEANLVAAQDRLTAARGDVALSLASIYKGLGGGWELRKAVPYQGSHVVTAKADGFPVHMPPSPRNDDQQEPAFDVSDVDSLDMPQLGDTLLKRTRPDAIEKPADTGTDESNSDADGKEPPPLKNIPNADEFLENEDDAEQATEEDARLKPTALFSGLGFER